MPVNNLLASHHDSFSNNELCENRVPEDKQNKSEHDLLPKSDLPPEDVARIIWEQWMTIRKIADMNLKIEIRTNQTD